MHLIRHLKLEKADNFKLKLLEKGLLEDLKELTQSEGEVFSNRKERRANKQKS